MRATVKVPVSWLDAISRSPGATRLAVQAYLRKEGLFPPYVEKQRFDKDEVEIEGDLNPCFDLGDE